MIYDTFVCDEEGKNSSVLLVDYYWFETIIAAYKF